MSAIGLDATLRGLAGALAVREARHRVLASNLANVETPGFRAQEIDFGRALGDAFAAAGRGEQPVVPAPADDGAAPARADGNTVDVDLQMMKLTENAGQFATLSRLLAKRLGLLRHAIEGVR